ncbi:hypothetical protein [uncultured Roseibium sp.]|uniref:hypothetical protein n=1 Tax=uncultured Roseibium sp. TaxID=1936171 RepID=UPI0026231433|nr:hypothetical protein [uncultured Roseibium sp.]
MTRMTAATVFLLSTVLAGTASAQNNQLRGLPQSGSSLLPSAQQQLNQNRNRQQSGFSTRQQIEGANRLNRTDQINRANTRPVISSTPCAGANESCQNK